MQTTDVRNLILSTPLQEQAVTNNAVWPGANLIVRELSGKAGSDLVASCTDSKGKVDQTSLIAGVILETLRNADDPNKALVFGMDDGTDAPNPAYKDSLLSIGLGKVMSIAQQSINLSGLDAAAKVEDSKNA